MSSSMGISWGGEGVAFDEAEREDPDDEPVDVVNEEREESVLDDDERLLASLS